MFETEGLNMITEFSVSVIEEIEVPFLQDPFFSSSLNCFLFVAGASSLGMCTSCVRGTFSEATGKLMSRMLLHASGFVLLLLESARLRCLITLP
jgi:hypothetical protein